MSAFCFLFRWEHLWAHCFSNTAFAPFAPMLWLSIIISVIMGITGIGVAKLKGDKSGSNA